MKLDLDKVLKHRILMLSGDEEALRRRALTEIVLEASGGDDFDLETFVGDSSNSQQWMASAGTSPFLSPKRTVVVRNVLRSEDFDGLAKSDLPESALVILVADEEPGDENKQRRLSSNRQKWEKAVNAVKGHVLPFTANPQMLRDTIKEEAKKLDKTISDRAVETLAEMCGGSLSRAMEEVEKLALFAGAKDQIGEAEIKAVVVPSREWNVFKLIDGVVAGDAGEALRQLRTLIGSTNKPEDTAFRSILPLLTRQFRMLWQARICIDAKTQPGTAPDSVRSLFPDKPNLGTEKDYNQRRAMNAARNVSFEQLSGLFMVLSNTDARLKGMEPSYTSIDTLERMILDMIEITRPKAASR